MARTSPQTRQRRTPPRALRESGSFSRTSAPPRRPPPRARGECVVRAVLEAALDELAQRGYSALTIEQVAARARVNKTTVYRRWPTRAELVQAALTSVAEAAGSLQESGDVRTDLLAVARRLAGAMSSPRGRALARMLLGGCAESDLVALAFSIRKQFEAPARRIVERAVLRGDLRPDLDPDLLLDGVAGWIVHTLFRERAPVTEARLGAFVDLLLQGALRPGGPSSAPPDRRAPPRRR